MRHLAVDGCALSADRRPQKRLLVQASKNNGTGGQVAELVRAYCLSYALSSIPSSIMQQGKLFIIYNLSTNLTNSYATKPL